MCLYVCVSVCLFVPFYRFFKAIVKAFMWFLEQAHENALVKTEPLYPVNMQQVFRGEHPNLKTKLTLCVLS